MVTPQIHGLRALATGLLVVSLALSPTMSSAAPTSTDLLRNARIAYKELEYEQVLPLLRKALQARPTPEEQVKIFELMAYVHVLYGRNRQARNAFIRLLERNPNFELAPDISPKILQVFGHAQEEQNRRIARKQSKNNASEGKERNSEGGSPPVEELEEESPPEETIVAQQEDTEFSATSPPLPEVSTSLDSGPPVYEQWWFWTALGVVAVGAGISVWALSQSETPNHDYGPILLP